ncbi:MAG TPA: RNA-guided endonuclease TnpB family protein [Actinomycetota bacterium]|nr:RNA-guided endonuclease TnpB family protein [Actinomycetota bacterium]
MTLSQRGGRLVVAVQAIVAQQPRRPAEPEERCGVDLGIGPEWAVMAHHDGTIERTAHPAPWKEIHQQQRRLARQVSRRTVGSRAHRHAKTKRAALDRRAANLRRQAIHVLTTRLARRYGIVVVEDLDVAAMQRSMGRRAFRRAVSQAGIGGIRPTLAYKCPAAGGGLVVADRWFGSSKSHHGCGGYRADLKLGDRVWSCPRCGRLVPSSAHTEVWG